MEVEAYAWPAPTCACNWSALPAAAQVAGQKETRTDLGAARGAQGSPRWRCCVALACSRHLLLVWTCNAPKQVTWSPWSEWGFYIEKVEVKWRLSLRDQRFFELSDVSCNISKWGKVTKREWLRRLRGPRSKCSNPFLLAAALPSRCALPPLLHCHLYFSGWYFLISKTPVKYNLMDGCPPIATCGHISQPLVGRQEQKVFIRCQH